ncbi:TRAP transporter small permease [Polycladidibacter hongkongensis]|uniref:TRAP transporter small permease n=1 Tax=Polycladidibacter hongkongensis TaxID=1647556 RepID=UPI00082D1EAD|nr:TRAP transporter small permease [Pseudovibrio hongkongensis]
MTSFYRLMDRLSVLPVWVASAALFALMLMTFFDVIMRSLFNAPFEPATELTRILMAVLVFSVLPLISVRGGHINVDLLDGLFLRLRLHVWRDGLISLICGGLLYWPVMRLWVLAERARDYGDVTEYVGIPVYLVGWFICAMVALTAAAMIMQGLGYLARAAGLVR